MKKLFKLIVSYFRNLKYFRTYTVKTFLTDGMICLQYSNNSDEDATAYMFGYNQLNDDTKQFGNKPPITVVNLLEPSSEVIDYVKRSQNGLCFGKIRMSFSGKDRQFYLTNAIRQNQADANGTLFSWSFLPLNYFDLYQAQENIIDIGRDDIQVDGNTHFEFKVAKQSSVVFELIPEEVKTMNYFEYKKYEADRRIKHSGKYNVFYSYGDSPNIFVRAYRFVFGYKQKAV